MVRAPQPVLAVGALAAAILIIQFSVAFVVPAARLRSLGEDAQPPSRLAGRGQVQLWARGGGEYNHSGTTAEAQADPGDPEATQTAAGAAAADPFPTSPLAEGDLGFLLWLLKDAAWVLFCPYVSIPAAAAAIFAGGVGLFREWSIMGTLQRMHGLGAVLWLMGNAVWMWGELLYSPLRAGRDFPWYHGPLLGVNVAMEGTTIAVTQQLFALGLVCWAGGYLNRPTERTVSSPAVLPPGAVSEEEAPQRLGKIEVDILTRFMGPWIIKDLFWSFESLTGALVAAAVSVALIISSLRKQWDERLTAELIWVLGNTLRVGFELTPMDDRQWLRVLVGIILLAGFLPLLQRRVQRRLRRYRTILEYRARQAE